MLIRSPWSVGCSRRSCPTRSCSRPGSGIVTGRYLAYLLSGSRRKGLLLRRPMEPRNADRARLMLAMTYAMISGPTDEAIRDAAALLDQRVDVRTALSPVVVAKYLAAPQQPVAAEDVPPDAQGPGPGRRVRPKRMIDAKGALNPGLMPQRLDDLRRVAPPRTDVDDVLVERWNRVAEVWRMRARSSAGPSSATPPAGPSRPGQHGALAEVVYPADRARPWQRGSAPGPRRSGTTSVTGSSASRTPAWCSTGRWSGRPGRQVARLEDRSACSWRPPARGRGGRHGRTGATRTIAWPPRSGSAPAVNLADDRRRARRRRPGARPPGRPQPVRFTQGELTSSGGGPDRPPAKQDRDGAKPATHRHVPVGPYRLTVIPSIRGQAAGQIAIQGMSQKQIESPPPRCRTKGSPASRWWPSGSTATTASRSPTSTSWTPKYVLWHAPRAHQLNFDDPADLNHDSSPLAWRSPTSSRRS